MHLKMPSGKWRPSCLGLNVLTHKLSAYVAETDSWQYLHTICYPLLYYKIWVMTRGTQWKFKFPLKNHTTDTHVSSPIKKTLAFCTFAHKLMTNYLGNLNQTLDATLFLSLQSTRVHRQIHDKYTKKDIRKTMDTNSEQIFKIMSFNQLHILEFSINITALFQHKMGKPLLCQKAHFINNASFVIKMQL